MIELKFSDSISGNFDIQKPPKTLFHYTSLDALVGISSTKKIWFTNVHNTND